LDETHAADDGENFAGVALGIGGAGASDLVLAYAQAEAAAGELRDVRRSEAGDEVAEFIDFDDDAGDLPIGGGLGARRGEANEVGYLFAELRGRGASAEMSRDGGKNIAPMKCLADRLQEVVLGGEVAHAEALFALVDEREHAIIGRQKNMAAGAEQDGAARRADAGIDDHEMNGLRRKVMIRLGDGKRASEHVERLHSIAD